MVSYNQYNNIYYCKYDLEQLLQQLENIVSTIGWAEDAFKVVTYIFALLWLTNKCDLIFFNDKSSSAWTTGRGKGELKMQVDGKNQLDQRYDPPYEPA